MVRPSDIHGHILSWLDPATHISGKVTNYCIGTPESLEYRLSKPAEAIEAGRVLLVKVSLKNLYLLFIPLLIIIHSHNSYNNNNNSYAS